MREERAADDADEFGGTVIDIEPEERGRSRKVGRWLVALLVLLLLFALTRAGSVYIETLWFGSLGYSSVYWTTFRYGWGVFAVFALATALVLRAAFYALERAFAVTTLAPRRLVVNNEPVFLKPVQFLKPAAWVVSLLLALVYGLGMSEGWRTFALWLNRPATAGAADPVFGNATGYYLFTLPAL